MNEPDREHRSSQGEDSAIEPPIANDEPAAPPLPVRPLLKRRVWRVIRFLLILYALWLATLYVLQEWLIFPGWTMRAARDALTRPRSAEVIWIESAGGVRVEAWFIPGRGRSAAEPGPLVVFAHGNADLIDDYPFFLEPYTRQRVSILLVEFRGFGRSNGRPGQAGIVADFTAAYDQVVQRPEVDATRVFFHGRSLGGAVVAQLAAGRTPAAMILESCFTSLTPMAYRYLAPPFILRHRFHTDRVVADLDAPLLIMHGARDDIIPVSHGRKLHELAVGSQYVEFNSGHNDFPPDPQAYWAVIEAFLRGHSLID